MAAAYTAGIVRNHPFMDGNKRTGFVVGILFLELNGYRFTASEEDAAKAVMPQQDGTPTGGSSSARRTWSMPLSMLFDPDSFYFGVLPVVAEVAGQLGVPAVHVGQAALLGQMTTGFPVSPLTPATFLVVGLCGIELADHQKFTFPLLFGASIVMTMACVVLGVFPL